MRKAAIACVWCVAGAMLLSVLVAPPASARGTRWGTAELVERDDTGDAGSPQVAVDPSGNATAVWTLIGGTREGIWANRYIVGSGWGSPELLGGNSGLAVFPQVAVDPAGNAVAVWCGRDSSDFSIYANRYAVGRGWGTEELLETDDTGWAFGARVALDSGGNATAVWEQSNRTVTSIWSNRYVVGTGWGAATLLEADYAGTAEGLQLAVDPGGNATAIWYRWDGSYWNIVAIRYAPGTGWGTVESIGNPGGVVLLAPVVAADPSGNAVAVWQMSSSSLPSQIHANRYVVGSGWGIEEFIEADSESGEAPQVAVDSAGNAVAVWQQADGQRTGIWANRYTVGTGWGTVERIEVNGTIADGAPHVAVDRGGDAVVVWTTWNGTARSDILARRYTVGAGWGTGELIVSATDVGDVQVAVSPAGDAVVVWKQWDGTRDSIYATGSGIYASGSGTGAGNALAGTLAIAAVVLVPVLVAVAVVLFLRARRRKRGASPAAQQGEIPGPGTTGKARPPAGGR